MTQDITIDRSGRVVLPSAVRRLLNLSPGSRLTLDVVAQRIELTPKADAELLRRPGQRTVLKPSRQPFDAAAAVRAERDAQAQRKR